MVPPPGVASGFGAPGSASIPPPAVLGMVNTSSIMGASSGISTPPVAPAMFESSKSDN